MTLLTSSAFAKDMVVCNLELMGNKVSCPPLMLFGCEEKTVLQSSKRRIVVPANEDTEGNIPFNHVALKPEVDHKSKHDILLFTKDNRHEKLKKDHGISLTTYKANENIDYTLTTFGDHVMLRLDYADQYKESYLELQFSKESAVEGFMFLDEKGEDRRLIVDCRIRGKEVNDEERARKEAIKNLKKETQESTATKK